MGRVDPSKFGFLLRARRKEEDPLSVEQLKVETLESDVERLLETLAEFTQSDLLTFRKVLLRERRIFKLHSDIRRRLLLEADLQDAVLVMVEIFGLQSVDITKHILMKMKKTGPIMKLSGAGSTAKGTNQDKRLAALIHKVASMAVVKDLLSEILTALNPKEFKILKWFVQSTFFHMGVPLLPWSRLVLADTEQVVDQLVRLFGRRSVEVTAAVLTDMNLPDLAFRLSEGYIREKEQKEELPPELDKQVEQLESVMKQLLNGLAELRDPEFEDLKYEVLRQIGCKKDASSFHWELVQMTDLLDLTFLLVQTYGQESVKLITGIFHRMKWSVPSGQSISSSVKEVNKWQSALIRKVAIVSAVKLLLLRAISDLSDGEFDRFKTLLLTKCAGSFSPGTVMYDRAEIVDLMMEDLGQRSLEVTRQLLIALTRRDLLPRLPVSSSKSKDNLLVVKAAAPVKRDFQEEDFGFILLEKLRGFDLKNLDKFRWLLQFTSFRRSIPQIPEDQLEKAGSPHQLFFLMLERIGQESLEVAREVFIDMNRSDLLEGLPDTSSASEADLSALLQSETNFNPDMEKIYESLRYLSYMELEHFKKILQKTLWSKGFRLALRNQDEASEKLKLAEVMELLFGKQSLQVTMELLEEIKRPDLQKQLSDSSSASERQPSGHPERGGHIEPKDSSEWKRVEPTVTDVGEGPIYSLQSAAGQFECSVSGLRWVCEDKLCFKYQFCSWEGHMERMKTRGYRSAGPLINITVVTGKIKEVYLPHWICIDDIPNLLESFSVLHINDSGDELEKVSEVTATHVGLTEPVFSPLAAVISCIFRVKVTCNVLIYYQPRMPFLKLHVYLILHDPALQQSVHKEESSSGYEMIKKPRPDGYLRMQQGFTLRAAIETAKVQPKKLTLRYDSQDPNFYEVFIENPNRNFDLLLLCDDSKKKKAKLHPVWTCEIRRDDHPKSGLVEAAASSGGATCLSSPHAGCASAGAAAAQSAEEHFVDRHREELIQRVSNVGPVLDGLLQRKVLLQETYDAISSLPTSAVKTREIFSCLRAGVACKDIFFSILQEKERFLIADLQKSNVEPNI